MTFDADRLKDLMHSRKLTLAVAESLTCGRIQAAIGAASGASNYFLGGMTAYTIEQKARHLNVDRQHAKKVNAVSPRVAKEMACGVAQLFGSDYAIGTTGYAEALPAEGVSVPFAFFAIWKRIGKAGKLIASGKVKGPRLSRTDMQQHVAIVALARLQRLIATTKKPSVAATNTRPGSD